MKEVGKSIIEAMIGNMDKGLTVAIKDYEVCGQKAKVKVSVVASEGTTSNDVIHALNDHFGGRLRAVARSFTKVAGENEDRSNIMSTISGYVVPNIEIVAAASDEGKTMKCVASNMFLDQTDCIWTKTGDFLYKKSDVETSEELNKFLTECSSSNVRIRKASSFDRMTAVSGDFISYMSQGEMCYGIVVASDDEHAKLIVIAEGEEEPEVIDTFDIQNKAEFDPDDQEIRYPEENEMVETSATSVDINAVTNYYKRWFQYNKNYANMLISRLKSHQFC